MSLLLMRMRLGIVRQFSEVLRKGASFRDIAIGLEKTKELGQRYKWYLSTIRGDTQK